MPRCDYDVVFYRVFCITLLGVAFSFTVILTNVFIDIDGLLYNKNKEKQSNLETVKSDYEVISTNYRPQDTVYEDYDAYDTERTKRSLEPEDIIQQIKDVQLKNILKKRLFSYIQQLGEETEKKTDKKDTHSEEKDKSNTKDNKNTKNNEVTRNSEEKDILKDKDSKNKDSEETDTNIDVIKDIERLKIKKDIKNNDEMLHLAIHNVILQGIIGHMDLKDVYNKAHEMAVNLEDSSENDNRKSMKDSKFVNELMDCQDLHEDIAKEKTKKISKEFNQNDKKKTQNVIIKTLINITSLVNEKVNQDIENIHYDMLNSKETLNGIIKLIFNGKEINFKNIEEKTTKKPLTNKKSNTYVPNVFMKNILNEYLNKYKENEENHNKRNKRNDNLWKHDIMEYLKQFEDESEENDKNKEENDRHKRNNDIIKEYLKKINYNGKINNHKINKRDSEITTIKPKDDDELFVEIETHFDSKGMKGDRKKKLIRDLVDKIQKAIHSDNPTQNNSNKIKKKHKNLHVRKRMQNPLDRNDRKVQMSSKFNLKKLGHRTLDPISKIISLHERIPLISNHDGDTWNYNDDGPKFLKPSKSINSAEKNEYETDFKPDLESEIPQRLQVPLMIGDTANFYDLGHVTFLMKNIDDSGFSIGYNQYTDLPPDQETMKLFTGLENIIQTYHQKYDVEENVNEHSEHEIVRRAIKDSDYHSNEYKIIFNNNFLPFNNYQDVYNQKMVKEKIKHKKNNNKAFVIDESIFNKELKPAEIFSLANYFDRKKRSMNVNKVTNIRKKKKLSRYLNTKAMRKRFYIHKKRNKRQIDKIRIIARDMTPKHSEEEIFVVSDEKILADRALVKDINIDLPEVRTIDDKEIEHYDVISPQKGTSEHFDIITPFHYPPKENDYSDVFSKISRRNSLMSKYPHIFMEEVDKPEDEYDGNNPGNNHKEVEDNPDTDTTTVPTVDTNYYDHLNMPKPVYDDYTFYDKTNDKKNYKVTVKITPKNSSLHSGFKEVHTSINKSYNKNGLLYTSLVNVSELSKVEKAKKEFQHINLYKLKEEHDKIKEFIEQHKNRLEQQLALLNNERKKLDNIDENFNGNVDQFNNNNIERTDVTTTSATVEDKKIIVQKNESTTTTTTTTTTAASTNIDTTTYKTTTPHIEKQIIINTIQKNDNITNQILSKINMNNELLKTFLEKLTNKLITTTPKAPVPTEITLPEPYEQMKRMFFNNNPRELKNDPMSVPFIYMYQNPVNISRHPANILYHGHIHSDAYNQLQKYNKEIEQRKNIKNVEKTVSNSAKPPHFIETPNFAKPPNYEHLNLAKTPNFIETPNFAKPPNYEHLNFAKTPNFIETETPNFAKPPNYEHLNYVKPPNLAETPNYAKPPNYEHLNFAKTPNFIETETPNFAKPPNYEHLNYVKPPNLAETPNYAKPPNYEHLNFAKTPNFIETETPNFAKPSNYEHLNYVKPPNLAETPNYAKPPNYEPLNYAKPHNFIKPLNLVKDPKYVKLPSYTVKNDTKFFVDEENDFKILPIKNKKYSTKAE